MPSIGKALFGNLLDEFGDAAAPVIRRVLSALGDDASEKVARDAVRREVRTVPNQKKAATRRAPTTTEPTRRSPPVEELAVKPRSRARDRTPAAKTQTPAHDIEVFHGTTRDFEVLDPSRAKAGLGVYATPNRDFAAEFARDEGRVLSGRLRPDDVVDLSAFGAFPEKKALGDIAAKIGANSDDLAQVYRELSRQQGDVHMFSLLENAGVEIPERTAWQFQDWGQGAPEPAYVFADPALFAVDRPGSPSRPKTNVDAPRRLPPVEDLAVKPGRKGF